MSSLPGVRREADRSRRHRTAVVERTGLFSSLWTDPRRGIGCRQCRSHPTHESVSTAFWGREVVRRRVLHAHNRGCVHLNRTHTVVLADHGGPPRSVPATTVAHDRNQSKCRCRVHHRGGYDRTRRPLEGKPRSHVLSGRDGDRRTSECDACACGRYPHSDYQPRWTISRVSLYVTRTLPTTEEPAASISRSLRRSNSDGTASWSSFTRGSRRVRNVPLGGRCSVSGGSDSLVRSSIVMIRTSSSWARYHAGVVTPHATTSTGIARASAARWEMDATAWRPTREVCQSLHSATMKSSGSLRSGFRCPMTSASSPKRYSIYPPEYFSV